jgi:hypothetical protein
MKKLVVMMVVDKWRSYLHNTTFTVRTGHQSLCHLQDQNLSTDLQKKAMRNLAGLQFRFAYKKGSENVVVDALSRVATHLHLVVVFTIIHVWAQEVINSYHNDEVATSLL